MLLLWLSLWLTLTVAPRPPAPTPPLCEGQIACCLDTLCVDCECQECLREGGVPAGLNTTCANDRCRCCEEPPLCDKKNFCHTVFEFCCEFEPCRKRWVDKLDDKWEFCACLDGVLEEACLTVEHVCESETTMGIFVSLLAAFGKEEDKIVVHATEAKDGSDSLVLWVLLGYFVVVVLVALVAYLCRDTKNPHQHTRRSTLAHYPSRW